jgi:hypothetical protein
MIYPVDWESAAVAVGEIDLAALTEGWPQAFVQQCELEYQRARWPDGPSTCFERRLAAARLYLQFRWLGSETDRDPSLPRFERLRCEGERLGLIQRARPLSQARSQPRPFQLNWQPCPRGWV